MVDSVGGNSREQIKSIVERIERFVTHTAIRNI